MILLNKKIRCLTGPAAMWVMVADRVAGNGIKKLAYLLPEKQSCAFQATASLTHCRVPGQLLEERVHGRGDSGVRLVRCALERRFENSALPDDHVHGRGFHHSLLSCHRPLLQVKPMRLLLLANC